MTRRRKRNKKWISKLFFLLLIFAAIVVCYFVWDGYFRDKNKEPEAAQDKEISVDVKEEIIEVKEEKKDEVTKKEEVVQYDGKDPNQAERLSGALTYAGVVGEKVMIRVNIDQYLGGGSCTLALKRDGVKIYSVEVPIVSVASTSTCEGFDIPLAEVGGGNTVIWIIIESEDRTGEIYGELNI